jgi:hypothetical protein
MHNSWYLFQKEKKGMELKAWSDHYYVESNTGCWITIKAGN